MKQEVEVLTIYEIGKREPKPIRFKLVENGEKKTIDVYSELGREYIGMNRLDYECNSLSSKGSLIVYKLSYYRNEGGFLVYKLYKRC